jgi:molybdopterin converting factor small subunit
MFINEVRVLLFCALKTQVKESKVEVFHRNEQNIDFKKLNAQLLKQLFIF